MAADVVGAIIFCHVAMCVHATWRYMCARVCTRVRVCARVFASVISGLSILFRIYDNPLNALH